MFSVSVIIPVYNKAGALGACLDSVLMQGKDVEIVCIDDGSTDGSDKILDGYAGKHANIVVRHTENRGVSAARNAGLRLASGGCIAFCDADDVMPEGALDALRGLMDSTGADIACGAIETETANGGTVLRSAAPGVTEDKKKTAAMTLDPLFDGCYGKLYRRCAVEGVWFEEDRRVNEDGDFVFGCLLNARKVAVTETPVYRYTFDAGSVSRSAFGEKFRDILYFGEKKYEKLNALGREYEDIANACLARHRLAYLNKMASCTEGVEKEELRKARADVVTMRKYLPQQGKKELIRVLLIRFAFPAYLSVMRRNG